MSFSTGSGNTLSPGQADGRRLQPITVESNSTMCMSRVVRILFVVTFLVASIGAAVCDVRCDSLGLTSDLAKSSALAGLASCCHGNSPAPEKHPSKHKSPQQCMSRAFTAAAQYLASAAWTTAPFSAGPPNPLNTGLYAVAFVSAKLFLPTQPAYLFPSEADPLPLRL